MPSLLNATSHDLSILDNIPCGYISFKLDGTIVSVNQTLLTWMDASQDEIVGAKRFVDLLNVGGRLYFQMVMVPTLARQGSVNEINFEITRLDNTHFPVLFNAVVTTLPGQDEEVVSAVMFKITDRKKHELTLLRAKRMAEEETKRFETLCNVIPNIIWTALPRGEINFVNDRFFDVFNVPRQGYTLAGLFSILHTEDRLHLSRNWKHAVLTGKNFEAEARIISSPNQYDWYLMRAVPYRDVSGTITMWFGSCTNINDHKEQEENLNASLTETNQRLDERDRTLQEISYSQSHLVRKPLANILGLVQMMNTNDIEDIQDLYPYLKQSAEELDEVIKSMIITV